MNLPLRVYAYRTDGTRSQITDDVVFALQGADVASIVEGGNDAGQITGLRAGTVTVDAFDPERGLRASDSLGPTTIRVEGVLREVLVQPLAITTGESRNARVHGLLSTGGVYQRSAPRCQLGHRQLFDCYRQQRRREPGRSHRRKRGNDNPGRDGEQHRHILAAEQTISKFAARLNRSKSNQTPCTSASAFAIPCAPTASARTEVAAISPARWSGPRPTNQQSRSMEMDGCRHRLSAKVPCKPSTRRQD